MAAVIVAGVTGVLAVLLLILLVRRWPQRRRR